MNETKLLKIKMLIEEVNFIFAWIVQFDVQKKKNLKMKYENTQSSKLWEQYGFSFNLLYSCQ